MFVATVHSEPITEGGELTDCKTGSAKMFHIKCYEIALVKILL